MFEKFIDYYIIVSNEKESRFIQKKLMENNFEWTDGIKYQPFGVYPAGIHLNDNRRLTYNTNMNDVKVRKYCYTGMFINMRSE